MFFRATFWIAAHLSEPSFFLQHFATQYEVQHRILKCSRRACLLLSFLLAKLFCQAAASETCEQACTLCAAFCHASAETAFPAWNKRSTEKCGKWSCNSLPTTLRLSQEALVLWQTRVSWASRAKRVGHRLTTWKQRDYFTSWTRATTPSGSCHAVRCH